MNKAFERARAILKDANTTTTFREKLDLYRQCRRGDNVFWLCWVVANRGAE